MKDIQSKLRQLGMVEVDDKLIMYGGEWMLLKTGDLYIAQIGDEDPELLTVRRIEVQKRSVGGPVGKVFPKERKKKLYNLHECIKITIRDNPNYKKVDENGSVHIGEARGANQQEERTPRLNPAFLARSKSKTHRDRDGGQRTNYTKPQSEEKNQ